MYQILHVILIAALFGGLTNCNNRPKKPIKRYAPFLKIEANFVDSLLKTMTLDEKIGQLIVVKTKADTAGFRRILENVDRVGGCYFQNVPIQQQVNWTDSLQTVAKFPLMMGMSKDHLKLPNPLTMAALTDDSLYHQITAMTVRNQRNLGMQIDWTPIKNLVPTQYTHENQPNIAQQRKELFNRFLQYQDSLHQQHLLTSFPSFQAFHQFKNDTINSLDSILQPYRKLVKKGVSNIEIADAFFKSDTFPKYPRNYIKNYFEEKLQYYGLITVNDLGTEYLKGQLTSGTDLFVVHSRRYHIVFEALKKLIRKRTVSRKRLNQRVQKILWAKYWTGIFDSTMIDVKAVQKNLQDPNFQQLKRQIREQTITIARNQNNNIPLKNLHQNNPYVVHLGRENPRFNEGIQRHQDYKGQRVEYKNGLKTSRFRQYDPLIIVLNDVSISQKDSLLIRSIQTLERQTNVVLINFKNYRNLQYLGELNTVIQTYDNQTTTQHLVAQLLYGSLQAKGRLPYYLSPSYTYGQGQGKTPITRLRYTTPEEAVIASKDLKAIDAIAQEAVRKRGAPGCQIWIAKSGKVIFHKAYGYHTYNKKRKVKTTDIYDVASITKVVSTTLSTMLLYEADTLKMSDSLFRHLPDLRYTQLKNITLKNLFIHQSGLKAAMPIRPFLRYTNKTKAIYFRTSPSEAFPYPVAHQFYLGKRWKDSLWSAIKVLDLPYKGRYKYSDINMNIAQRVIETKANVPLNVFADSLLFQPLNLRHTGYLPLKRFEKKQIVPTEIDRFFRKQLVHGYVHDESAALLGGVGGNAGLFSTANDLGIVFQMLLNGGSYGGQRFFKPKTVRYFTAAIHGNERGLGFNKQTFTGARACAINASMETYGHTGFTGCCVWADPKHDLVYVFLSNRVYPRRNGKLGSLKTRQRIHQVIYNALAN